VTTGRAVEGPLISRTENREHFSRRTEAGDTKIKATGTLSPASTVSDVSLPSQASSTRSGRSSRMSSVLTTSDKGGQHRPADPRFAAGSTTRSSFRDLSAYNEEARPQSVKPIVSLRMEGDFSRSVSSKEHYQPLPYSRTPATIRKSMMEVPKGTIESTTTYRQNTTDKELYNGLRRSSRFDYSLRIPDKIDWL